MESFPPPNSALFGSTGFVGTSLRRALRFDHAFRSTDAGAARGRRFSTVVCAALPAAKWLANKDPDADLANLRKLEAVLAGVECDRFVLISTIDVYNPADGRRDEDGLGGAADMPDLHPYGRHRALLERFVRDRFPDHLVLRLPALFGIHLKKNYVYDLLVGNNLPAINMNSAFQWYDVSRLSADMQRALELGLREANLFPEPVPTAELIRLISDAGLLAGDVEPRDVGHGGPPLRYDCLTKHGQAFGAPAGLPYICTAAQVLASFSRFLGEWNMFRRTSVSCIAWDEPSHDAAVSLLRTRGYRYIEVAPTRFFAWDAIERAVAGGVLDGLVAGFAADLAARGLGISSLQAVLFGKPDLVLFGTEEARGRLARHLRVVVDFAASLRELWRPSPGPFPIVFGAPKNRRIPDGMSHEEADRIFCALFGPLAEYAHSRGCALCLEPNAPQYGCNFATTSAHALSLVRRVGHPGLQVHLDAACMAMAGRTWRRRVSARREEGQPAHFHVSSRLLRRSGPQVDHARG
ncbi:xylose isomerase-like protein [Hyaloraphidium curvatum]|nr:xylose isomerase-like protein [Hyaloraphidium curvatum]